LSAQADVSAHNIKFDIPFGSRFTVWRGQEVLGEVQMRVPGLHNVYNALAAIAISFELEVPFEKTVEGLGAYTGVNRRFQFKGEERGVLVVDDYGHHPTEIRATLAAAKIGSSGRRMVVLFQPHRYTRTQDQMDEFARSFNNADVLLVTDIYAASEDPIEGITAEALVEAVKRYGHKNTFYVGSLETAVKALLSEAHKGDMVITLGAGNVFRAGEELIELLRKNGNGHGLGNGHGNGKQ
jgi:UDP-N-acetylmuramate--alanine ligase